MSTSLKPDAAAAQEAGQSGLLGVSGISSDMRALEASTEPGAKAAIDLFVHRIGRELGALAAAQAVLAGAQVTTAMAAGT